MLTRSRGPLGTSALLTVPGVMSARGECMELVSKRMDFAADIAPDATKVQRDDSHNDADGTAAKRPAADSADGADAITARRRPVGGQSVA